VLLLLDVGRRSSAAAGACVGRLAGQRSVGGECDKLRMCQDLSPELAQPTLGGQQ